MTTQVANESEMYNYIISFLGISKYERHNDYHNDVVDIELGTTEIEIVYNDKNDKNDKKWNYQYINNIFIILLLIWTPFASIILSIYYKDSSHIVSSLYNIIFVSHYIHSMTYFKKKHMNNSISKNNKLYVKMVYCSLIVALMISIANVIILNMGFNVHVYSVFFNIDGNTKLNVFLSIILFLESIYGYVIFFITSITFCFVLMNDKTKINNYRLKLHDYIKGTSDMNTKVNSIANEYTKMKESFSKTVENLNTYFVAMNIIGIAELCAVISTFGNGNYDYIMIGNIVLFLIIEFMYILSIQNVRSNIDSIISMATSQKFISSIFRTSNTNKNIEMSQDITMENILDTSKQSLIAILSIDESIDWLVLNTILTKEWDSFNFLGVKIDDSAILQKLLGVILAMIFADNVMTFFN